MRPVSRVQSSCDLCVRLSCVVVAPLRYVCDRRAIVVWLSNDVVTLLHELRRIAVRLFVRFLCDCVALSYDLCAVVVRLVVRLSCDVCGVVLLCACALLMLCVRF